MNTKSIIQNVSKALVTLFLFTNGVEITAFAQSFNSGSDGSYGQMNIISNTTLNLPTNGIFNCTTITVASGATLKFNRNGLNTPVYLLATDDVTITGIIDVSASDYIGISGGKGGLGGFDGGDGGKGGSGLGGTGLGGDGQGPGGGRNVDPEPYKPGVFAQNSINNTRIYGNSLLIPFIGGSGAAGVNRNSGGGGGGWGGGAILVASNTKIIVTGQIRAIGGQGQVSGGSGGAIRLVSPTVSGSGTLLVPGGPVAGGSGRIRVDCLDGNAVKSLRTTGVASRGAQMYVFPTVVPRLDIIEAAGQLIPFPPTSGVSVVLLVGTPTNQIIRVQAKDFTNDVPITVAVIPNDRPTSNYLATITMTNNPSVVSVPVTLAVDSTNRIMVWTR